jgi:methylase of polypeptide subunit release factors
MHQIDVGYLVGGTNVLVRYSDRAYALQPEAAANWVWHAFRGFARLKHKRPRVFASIGSGTGVDAIGAARIFEDLERIIVTDVEQAIVEQAVDNVRRNVRPDIEVIGLCGDVCTPLLKSGMRADIIYANLPNIPAHEPRSHGTFYRPQTASESSGDLGDYLLGLQHRFLVSAKHALSPEGEVAFMIGGRFPLCVLDTLQVSTAFELREIVSALKVQTEAECVTAGYAERERDSVRFEFYDYERASTLLGPGAPDSGAALKARLAAAMTSATEALAIVRNGGRVGHTLHMLAGR